MSERAVYWSQLLAEWAGSGLSQAEFCRRRGVKLVTFAGWKRRLGVRQPSGGHRASRGVGRGGFVELAWPRESTWPDGDQCALAGHGDAPRYELILAGRVRLRLPDDFDPERVARLLRAVAASC
jgi:hypothetical protein